MQQADPNLTPLITHFGDMSSRWGFNRSVGQLLALLLLADKPISADQIAAQLGISRGNVSMAARELHNWQLIRTHREPGDRKDYLEINGNIWQLAQQVLAQRQRREIDPTQQLLTTVLENLPADAAPIVHQRLQSTLDLLRFITRWLNQLQTINPQQLEALFTLGREMHTLNDLKNLVTQLTNQQE